MLLLFCALLTGCLCQWPTHPCSITKPIDEYFKEVWDFMVPGWNGVTVSTNPYAINKPPLDGNWSFDFQFCSSLKAKGSTGATADFGRLFSFDYIDHLIPIDAPAGLEFSQVYVGEQYSATIKIYCTNNSTLDCKMVGSNSSACLNLPSEKAEFCLCSFRFANDSIARALEIILLSNDCPDASPVAIPPESHAGRTFGLVVALLLGITLALYVSILLYRYFGLGLRGEKLSSFLKCFGSTQPEDTAGTYGQVSRGTYEAL